MAAYNLEQWHDIFVALGAVYLALLGVLVAALAVYLGRIASPADHRTKPQRIERARSSMLGLAAGLVITLLALIPGEDVRVFAALSILAFALTCALQMAWVIGVQRIPSSIGVSGTSQVASIALSASVGVVGAVGSGSILIAWGGGLYWTMAALTLAAVVCMRAAWAVLFRVNE